MEDLLKYINRDDLASGVILHCNVVQGTARTSGKPYCAIELEFVNGFKKRLFLNDSENH